MMLSGLGDEIARSSTYTAMYLYADPSFRGLNQTQESALERMNPSSPRMSANLSCHIFPEVLSPYNALEMIRI